MMKRVELRRAWSRSATLGIMTIDVLNYPPIFTLENPLRESIKDSRIPAGTYECEPYSGTKYNDVYLVKDVPLRSTILIHWGNTESDTEGCILLGLKAGTLRGAPAVLDSKLAFKLFSEIMGKEQFRLVIMDQSYNL